MTERTIRRAVIAGAFVLASGAMAQNLQIQQMNKEISEFDGKQFTFQVFEDGAYQTKTVMGAPYSAEEKTVSTQTLADGNRIVNTTSAKVFRDQQGRTRLERSSNSDKTIMVNDPVTGGHYVLDEQNRSVMKRDTAIHQMEFAIKQADEAKVRTNDSSPKMFTFATKGSKGSEEKGKVEELGKQVMEGLSVEGTRTTVTIPAGQIGNERLIEIVSERWYSPDLQMVIMSKRNDPRMGETVYTVSNISRANPDASLFQIPAGYSETQNMQHNVIKRVVTHDE